MKMHVEASGFAELDRLLEQLPPAVERKALAPAVMAGAKVIAKETKRRAPKREGWLRKSVVTIMEKATRRAAPYSRTFVGAPVAALVGFRRKSGRHAHLVEKGTGYRPGAGTMPAQPFLAPAIVAKRQEAANVMGQRLAQSIAKEAAGLRSRAAPRIYR